MIKQYRTDNLNLLVVDPGRFTPFGTDAASKLQSTIALRSMVAMGYNAVGISPNDLRFGLQFLTDLAKKDKVPFVCCNLIRESDKKLVFPPFVVKKLGTLRTAIIGVSARADWSAPLLYQTPPPTPAGTEPGSTPPKAEPPKPPEPNPQEFKGLTFLDPKESVGKTVKDLKGKSDFIILLSAISPDDSYKLAKAYPQINIIMSDAQLNLLAKKVDLLAPNNPYYQPPFVKVGDTYIYHAARMYEGRSIGKLNVTLSNGKVATQDMKLETVARVVPDDPTIRAIVNQYYREVPELETASANALKRMAWDPMERDRSNNFVGNDKCGSCHQAELNQWKTTAHAKAFDTLVEDQKDKIPQCLACHTVGFGYAMGYTSGRPQDSLKGVGCESCHGPGSKHAAAPTKANIRRAITKQHCADCHTTERSTNFEQRFDELYKKTIHRQAVPTAETAPR